MIIDRGDEIVARNETDFLNKNLKGKTIVMTGGTDGMGRAAVNQLVKMGANLVLLGRNKEKTENVIDELNSVAGSQCAQSVQCDLSSQKSIRRAAAVILAKCPEIHVLINCAGVQPGKDRIVTEEGYELNWAVNHLAPFLLTHLLLDRLKASAPSRIVNLSSAYQKSGHIYLDDLQLEKNWGVLNAYPQAKLAINMWTRKMAKELEGSQVTVNALNPGFIKTNLGRHLKGWPALIGKPYMFFFSSKPEMGGNRIIRLAVADDYKHISGKFVNEDSITDPNPEVLDDHLVDQVWRISKEHVGINT